MRDIVLASASPRRRQLLEGIGLPHRVVVSRVAEVIPEKAEPSEVVKTLAFQKAAAVAEQLTEGIVIGADTIVVLDGQILGKPADRQDAFNMLQTLNGAVHQVITGLAVIDVKKQHQVQCSEVTEVAFKKLTEEEISSYINTGEPLDKAGAYGIQGLGGLFVKGIKGCYFNVVGLPLSLLADVLKEFHIDILQIRNTNLKGE